ncbi:MAG TPA: hypothetical protein PKW90_25300, partial [Myxococcota bacterium]|nr:hypothetical protein [Myxococcota bacterium]
MFATALLLLGLATPDAAAGVTVVVTPGGGYVAVDPWSPGYRPVTRSGWAWVDGHYDRWGSWVPGHWVPTYSRAGYDWVPGYWVGSHYYDGYWRPVYYNGYSWVSGGYYQGRYVSGYWRDARGARIEEARERIENRREWHEDRYERYEDAQERREDAHERWEDAQERR